MPHNADSSVSPSVEFYATCQALQTSSNLAVAFSIFIGVALIAMAILAKLNASLLQRIAKEEDKFKEIGSCVRLARCSIV
ncbi:hypothetical protein BD410DRAFT_388575 [Rickenella mellea]|uniref:Uncharacterized protein n=1 Tax=Rickenella mellea TaxID=50990 RepID=A0A4Y7PX72_9AGAM|nr:hypothetical protein BD410DRAFT_388575 [Rickenella mellea]